MKQIVLLALLAIAFKNLSAQTLNNQSKNFLIDFFKEQSSLTKQTVLYVKAIDQYQKDELKQAISRIDTLLRWIRVENGVKIIDSVILTQNEINFILSELENQTDTSLWNDIKIPSLTFISRDTVNAIFKDRNREWNYFHQKVGRSISSFTIPIFLRNDSLCFFYDDMRCGGLCGEGIFAIYKRENNRWVRWITIYEWIS